MNARNENEIMLKKRDEKLGNVEEKEEAEHESNGFRIGFARLQKHQNEAS